MIMIHPITTMATITATHIRLLLILPLLAACEHRSQTSWSQEELPRVAAPFQVERHLTPATDPRFGCQLELVEGAAYTCGYINRFGLPALQGEAPILCIAGSHRHTATATVLEGGQRLLLSNDTLAFISQQLAAHSPVLLQVPGGSFQLEPGSCPDPVHWDFSTTP